MIEKLSDWVWEQPKRFCACLGGLAVLGFGIGFRHESAPERAVELAESGLIDLGE